MHRHNLIRAVVVAPLLTVVACVPAMEGDEPAGPTPVGDEVTASCDDPVPAGGVDVVGSYDAAGVWDLSGPLNEDRGLGDVVADLFVVDAVDAIGAPSFVDDEIRDAVEDAIGQPIRDWVNGSAPDSFLRQDSFMADLITMTGQVEAFSRIDIASASATAGVTGVEELLTFRVKYRGVSHDIDANTVAGGASAVPVRADWNGATDGTLLSLDSSEFSVRYGEFAFALASRVMGIDALAEFRGRVTTAIDCPGLVGELTGADGEFDVSVAGFSASLDGSVLVSVCEDAVANALDSAIGIFDIDSGIVLGGDVLAIDPDCDGVADALASQEGYGGHVVIAGPIATAPRVGVTFRGTRAAR